MYLAPTNRRTTVGNLFGLKDRLAALVACFAAPSSNNWRDAYEGAREDLLDWKRRAQAAEAKLRGKTPAGVALPREPDQKGGA
jgi:hypothetical protein